MPAYLVRGEASEYFRNFQRFLQKRESGDASGSGFSEENRFLITDGFDVEFSPALPQWETSIDGAFPELKVLIHRRSPADTDFLRQLYEELLTPLFTLQITPGFLALFQTTEERGEAADVFLLGSSYPAALPAFEVFQSPVEMNSVVVQRLNEEEQLSITFQAVYALQCLAAAGIQFDAATAPLGLLKFDEAAQEGMRFHLPNSLVIELKTSYVIKFIDMKSAREESRPLPGELAAHTIAFLNALHGDQQGNMTQDELFAWFKSKFPSFPRRGTTTNVTDYVFPTVFAHLPIAGGAGAARHYDAFIERFFDVEAPPPRMTHTGLMLADALYHNLPANASPTLIRTLESIRRGANPNAEMFPSAMIKPSALDLNELRHEATEIVHRKKEAEMGLMELQNEENNKLNEMLSIPPMDTATAAKMDYYLNYLGRLIDARREEIRVLDERLDELVREIQAK